MSNKMEEIFFGNQKTIGQDIELFGLGLITGEITSVRIRKAPPDQGITFIIDGKEIPLSLSTTSIGFHNITIGGVMYIEHLLSALMGLGIDNVYIEADKEIPFFDGSSLIFTERILQVGSEEQKSPKRYFIPNDFEFSKGSSKIVVKKGKFKVHCKIKIKGIEQEYIFYENYEDEISPARTFIFEDELNSVINFFKGGTLESAIILSKDGKPINTNFRFENELARHKILDFLGDIFSTGFRIFGSFYIENPSHSITREFLEKLDPILL